MLRPPLPLVMPVAARLDTGAAGAQPVARVDGAGWFDGDAGRIGGTSALGQGSAASLPPSADVSSPDAGDDAGKASEPSAAVSPPALEGPPIPLPPPVRLSRLQSKPGVALDRRRISLDLRQAPLAAAFDAFARFTGKSVVLSGRVQGSVTLRIHDVRWRDAFDALLDANGLAMATRGDVIWVAPVAELAVRERERFEAHARAADLEPLASRTFVLRYPRANDVARLLAGGAGQRVLSRRGSVLADPRTNLLFVTDLDGRLAQIAALVAQLDRPARQVLIEARIVEGERGFSRELGARLALRTRGMGKGGAAAGDGADRTPDTASGGDPLATGVMGGSAGRLADLSAGPLSGFEAATAGLTLFVAGATRLLDIELSALESEGRGQILSRPSVVTADRAPALVEQGTELPYQAKVGRGVSGVQFRRATLKLEVEPQITPDGQVVLDLDIAKDSVGEQTDAGPAIHTKHVRTRVEVENGGTVSIGGIYERNEWDDVTRVPVLGKIPVLGALFRHKARREKSTELVVYITPRVVGEPVGAERQARVAPQPAAECPPATLDKAGALPVSCATHQQD
ncbi:type IV pilus secretin PilQ [Burkholderia sp. Ac-20379]|nr:type IV pilus secretin PilQ [Burkholderia sp. Ac-20379]